MYIAAHMDFLQIIVNLSMARLRILMRDFSSVRTILKYITSNEKQLLVNMAHQYHAYRVVYKSEIFPANYTKIGFDPRKKMKKKEKKNLQRAIKFVKI